MQQTIRTFVDSESDKLTIDLPQAFRHRHLEVLVIADDSSDILAEQKDTVRALRNSMGVLKGHIGDGVEYQNKCRSEWDTPDAIIAASALHEAAELVTRNSKDFVQIEGLKIINPFADES